MIRPLKVAFLWHMHQPFYRDPFSGQLALPWLRLHALKDYWGMAHMLREFPRIRVTFNLVPSLLAQLELYLQGTKDVFQVIAAKPAAELDAGEREFLIRHFFSANPDHQIHPYPRYSYLYQKKEEYLSHAPENEANTFFSTEELRDLQVWFTLSYFDRDWSAGDPRISGLIAKGSHFSEEDKLRLAEAELELLGKIIPLYRELFQEGRIEISTSPFYHPILPLLIDPSLGHQANASLPAYDLAFNWEEDARLQLEKSLAFMENLFGKKIIGIWPSEGSLSREVLQIMDRLHVLWTAADETNLCRSLSVTADRDSRHTMLNPGVFYQPYNWQSSQLRIFFRDHHLSDLIGFHYQKLPAEEAAKDMHQRLLAIPRTGEEDLTVPIILDGENAWEYYEGDGRSFLRSLYRLISGDSRLQAVTLSEALATTAGFLADYRAGSWINANFDIWIGDVEDRRGWDLLREAHNAFELRKSRLSDDQMTAAREHLLIAEGSDWFWWFGRENYTPHLDVFDHLFRENLRKVYDILALPVPENLKQPVCAQRVDRFAIHEPRSLIQPKLDGLVTDLFEWEGAGRIIIFPQGGAMHMAQPITQAMYYGFGPQDLYLRIDTSREANTYLDTGFSLELAFKNSQGETRTVTVTAGGERTIFPQAVRMAAARIIEIQIPFPLLLLREGDRFSLHLRWLCQKEILQEFPVFSELNLDIPDHRHYLGYWQV